MVYLPVDSQMKTFYISINFIVALHVNMLQRLHLPVNSTYLIKPVKTSTLLSNWRENLIDVWNWFLWCKDEIQVLSQVSLKTPTWCAITTQATGVNNRKKSQKDVVHSQKRRSNLKNYRFKQELNITFFFKVSTLNRGGWTVRE